MSDATAAGAAGAAAAQPIEDPFFWFHGASVETLYGRLGAAGVSTCRLEVRVRAGHLTFRVVPAGAASAALAGDADINESHICPFDCPS